MDIWTALATFLSLFALEHFAREVKMWRKYCMPFHIWWGVKDQYLFMENPDTEI